ncbi:hypothetical protein EYF80_053192 [Liparis tanakae]|uniref:Uncharacterized protein n=1 Tax=Liparis tanakae TaxID=230148 RepID=A0A4Z2F5X3_9TELE|nr:hypothetical protein EYF80_053192 [Liparis tanakae]
MMNKNHVKPSVRQDDLKMSCWSCPLWAEATVGHRVGGVVVVVLGVVVLIRQGVSRTLLTVTFPDGLLKNEVLAVKKYSSESSSKLL